MLSFGTASFLECGPAGTPSFSAAGARIRARRNRSIEEICCGARRFAGGLIGLPRQRAAAFVAIHREEVQALYAQLWDEYMTENPRLLEILCAASGVSDASPGTLQLSPARELWRIRAEVLSVQCAA